MTSRVYKSAQGKMVDIGALALKNETILAVSPGTKLNARGDRLDSDNRVIDKKGAQVQRQITQTTQRVNTSDAPIATSSKAAKEARAEQVKRVTQAKAESKAKIEAPKAVEEAVDIITGLDDVIAVAEVSATSNEGLAAAIARAKDKKAKE